MRRVFSRLREAFPQVDFILDSNARNTVHKFYVKNDEQTGDEFPIFDKVSNHYCGLSEESRIFEKIPKTFHVVRIYADVPKDKLRDYRKAANDFKKEEETI
jgi:hypothetical protein